PMLHCTYTSSMESIHVFESVWLYTVISWPGLSAGLGWFRPFDRAPHAPRCSGHRAVSPWGLDRLNQRWEGSPAVEGLGAGLGWFRRVSTLRQAQDIASSRRWFLSRSKGSTSPWEG